MNAEQIGDTIAGMIGRAGPPSAVAAKADEPKPWSSEDDSVVLREQPETRIFLNNGSTLTIMQRAAWDEDEDPVLTFALENLPHIIEALRRYVPAAPATCNSGGARV